MKMVFSFPLLLLIALVIPATAKEKTPFFPIGLYSVSPPNMKDARAMGFNLVVAGDEPAFLDSAAKYGLKVVANTFFQNRQGDTERVRALEKHPNLYAHVVADEPDIYGNTPDSIARRTTALRRITKKSVYLTVWSPENYPKYKKSCDIFSVTPYPITTLDPVTDLSYVYKSILLGRFSEPRTKKVWATIQAFAGNPFWPRPPSPAELRSMVYQALIAGIDGLVYYSISSGEPYLMPSGRKWWYLPEAPDLVAAITSLNKDAAFLGPKLLKGKESRKIHAEGPVIYITVESGRNRWLVASNTSNQPCVVKAPFNLTRRGGGGVDATKNELKFEPFGAGYFEITAVKSR